MIKAIKRWFQPMNWEQGTIEIYDRRGELVFAWNYGEDREVTQELKRQKGNP